MHQPKNIDYDVILPPHWAFGVLYGGYTDQKQTLEKVLRLIKEDYPIDAYWIDSCFWEITTKGPMGYIDFIGDLEAYPDMEEMWRILHEKCVKTGIWIWDRILKEGSLEVYEEFESKGYFSKTVLFGEAWHNKDGRSTSGYVDFNNPKAAALWKSKLKPFFEKGLDFIKLDAAAKLPYIKAGFEATQEMGLHTKGRGFVLSHQVERNDPTYKRYPTVWSGDTMPVWTQPEYPDKSFHTYGGLKENVEMVANPGHPDYAYPFFTNDTGGFSARAPRPSDELYMRWTQFSAFNPIMEVFGTMMREGQNAPYVYSKEAQDNFRFYTHLRMRLFPYIYSYAHLTRLTGQKMIQGDGMHIHQYMFGNELLVAPVCEEGAETKLVYLPEGRWIDYWTGVPYDGMRAVVYNTPVNCIPVFVKAAAIIPLRDYTRAIELGTNKVLTLDIYPEGCSSFTLYEDDGLSNDYINGGYASTEFYCNRNEDGILLRIQAVRGSYKGMYKERTYKLKVNGIDAPQGIQINDLDLEVCSKDNYAQIGHGWYYHRETNTVWVKLTTSTDKNIKILIK
mgnify:CR=1 FL=1